MKLWLERGGRFYYENRAEVECAGIFRPFNFEFREEIKNNPVAPRIFFYKNMEASKEGEQVK